MSLSMDDLSPLFRREPAYRSISAPRQGQSGTLGPRAAAAARLDGLNGANLLSAPMSIAAKIDPTGLVGKVFGVGGNDKKRAAQRASNIAIANKIHEYWDALRKAATEFGQVAAAAQVQSQTFAEQGYASASDAAAELIPIALSAKDLAESLFEEQDIATLEDALGRLSGSLQQVRAIQVTVRKSFAAEQAAAKAAAAAEARAAREAEAEAARLAAQERAEAEVARRETLASQAEAARQAADSAALDREARLDAESRARIQSILNMDGLGSGLPPASGLDGFLSSLGESIGRALGLRATPVDPAWLNAVRSRNRRALGLDGLGLTDGERSWLEAEKTKGVTEAEALKRFSAEQMDYFRQGATPPPVPVAPAPAPVVQAPPAPAPVTQPAPQPLQAPEPTPVVFLPAPPSSPNPIIVAPLWVNAPILGADPLADTIMTAIKSGDMVSALAYALQGPEGKHPEGEAEVRATMRLPGAYEFVVNRLNRLPFGRDQGSLQVFKLRMDQWLGVQGADGSVPASESGETPRRLAARLLATPEAWKQGEAQALPSGTVLPPPGYQTPSGTTPAGAAPAAPYQPPSARDFEAYLQPEGSGDEGFFGLGRMHARPTGRPALPAPRSAAGPRPSRAARYPRRWEWWAQYLPQNVVANLRSRAIFVEGSELVDVPTFEWWRRLGLPFEVVVELFRRAGYRVTMPASAVSGLAGWTPGKPKTGLVKRPFFQS